MFWYTITAQWADGVYEELAIKASNDIEARRQGVEELEVNYKEGWRIVEIEKKGPVTANKTMSVGKLHKVWDQEELLDAAAQSFQYGDTRKTHGILRECKTKVMTPEQLTTYFYLKDLLAKAFEIERKENPGPQRRIEKALDIMSHTGWSFGMIIEDIMETRGIKKASEINDEVWADLLEAWMPPNCRK